MSWKQITTVGNSCNK